MTEKLTDELDNLLAMKKTSDFKEYYRENKEYLKESDRNFYEYFKSVIHKKGIKLKDVYIRADVSESYGGKIIRMEGKHTTNRDLIIKLCLGGHFDWVETNRALKLYGFNELYAKIPRDALIMMAINERKYDIDRLNELLKKNEFDGLALTE